MKISEMGNCMMVLGLKKLKRPVTLLLVGLDNAGKTTAAKGIIGDSIENVAPTVGFSPETLEYRGCEITIYDLGGGSRIRAVWPKYFSEIHGVIFVIDSSDKTRIEECRSVLEELLSHKKVSGKPVLVLANKQDVEGALDEIDLVETLKIEQIVNSYKCPTRVETCSAVAIHKRKPDKPIADGFRWLIDTIVVHYKSLQKRVDEDMKEEQERLTIEMERRKERIKLLREERDRAEKLAEELANQRSRKDSDDDAIVVRTRHNVNRMENLDEEGDVSRAQQQVLSSGRAETEDSMTSSSDAKELQELGFKSSDSLASTTSSPSSSCASFTTQRAITSASNDNTSPHLIQVNPTSEEERNELAVAAELASQSLNNLLDSESYPEINLEDSLPRSTECVPIDSDDELFLSSVKGDEEEEREVVLKSSPPQAAVSNGSAIAGIKEQIELEASLNRKSKRKSFLKRLHKTAPTPASSVSTNIVSSEESMNQTPSGRVP